MLCLPSPLSVRKLGDFLRTEQVQLPVLIRMKETNIRAKEEETRVVSNVIIDKELQINQQNKMGSFVYHWSWICFLFLSLFLLEFFFFGFQFLCQRDDCKAKTQQREQMTRIKGYDKQNTFDISESKQELAQMWCICRMSFPVTSKKTFFFRAPTRMIFTCLMTARSLR